MAFPFKGGVGADLMISYFRLKHLMNFSDARMRMTILKEESSLFERWKGSRKGFVADGVVCEEDYLSAPLKLCFVLKEVNDLSGGGWDLREFIRNGARPQSWDNITRWIRCIESSGLDIHWKDLKSVTEDQRKSVLTRICAMNMKKSPGGHTTERASFQAVVAEDRECIREQYALYQADLTICCGTGWDLRWALGLDDVEVLETTRGIKWFLNAEQKPVIMYSHPEARVQNSLLVYGLVDAVREVFRNQSVGQIPAH